MAERYPRTNMHFFLHLILIMCGLAVFSHAATTYIYLSSEGTQVPIMSPYYPNGYYNTMDILWKVMAPTGFRVMVQFTVFDVQSFDYLILYHGLTDSFGLSKVKCKLSGSVPPPNISSIGSFFWLRFKTDVLTTNGEKGFSLLVSAVKMAYYLSSEGPNEKITSPNYPNDYNDDVDIMWEVIAPTGFSVMVQFTDFKLIARMHKLKVYHGLTNSFEDAELIDELTGTVLPHSISSIGSYLWLRFTTITPGTSKGFSLFVSAVETAHQMPIIAQPTPLDVIEQDSNVISKPSIVTSSATSSAQSSALSCMVPILISTFASPSALDILVVIVYLVCRRKGLKHVSSQGIAASGEPRESPGRRGNPTFESSYE